MSVGERIKLLRQKKKMTLRELSEKVGISISFLSDIENNRSNPSLERLKEIAKALDTSVSYLLGEDNPEPKTPADEITEAVSDDPELLEFWKELREREDLKLLFKQAKKLTPKDIKQVIRIIKAIEDEEAKE